MQYYSNHESITATFFTGAHKVKELTLGFMRYIPVCAFILLLSACSKPLPDARKDYIGHWQSEEMSLVIYAQGEVNYERRNGNTTTSVKGPLKEFIGDDFVVGIWFMTTQFYVSSPPQKIDGVWQMTVDGVTLKKLE